MIGSPITNVQDVHDLLKFLANYSGLSPKVADQCKAAERVMYKNIAIGPGGVSSLKASGGLPAAAAPSGSPNGSTYDVLHRKQWRHGTNTFATLAEVIRWLDSSNSPSCIAEIEFVERTGNGSYCLIYRFKN